MGKWSGTSIRVYLVLSLFHREGNCYKFTITESLCNYSPLSVLRCNASLQSPLVGLTEKSKEYILFIPPDVQM